MRPLRGLQETRVATREESGVLGFPSRRGLTPQGSLEKVILKDRFLTQSAPDIRRKLLKQAYGPNQSLDTLLQLAQPTSLTLR